jgi:hypothetical protein
VGIGAKAIASDCDLAIVGDVMGDSGNGVRVVRVYTLSVSPTVLVCQVVLSPVERQGQKGSDSLSHPGGWWVGPQVRGWAGTT